MAGELLILFLKAPRPGTVKTRLAASLGAEAACQAYGLLVDHLVAQLAAWSPVEIRFAPDEASREIAHWLQPGWSSRPQGEGDLGQRLARGFQEAFTRGHEKVVAIGADCPDVQPQDIRDAMAALAGHEAVIGPAADGGYWLLGLNAFREDLFHEMPWSTNQVLPRTLERLASTQSRYHQLRTLVDVDTEAEWQHYQKKLALGKSRKGAHPE